MNSVTIGKSTRGERLYLVKRFPFLDWMRGLAVVIMIQCHTFNSFGRMDLRPGGAYILSQFVGGMAAPLFLFMAGMTLAFQMDSLERREPSARQRWLISLKRGGYILMIAYLFRLSNWAGSLPYGSWREITKVDILNCMGLAVAAFSVVAIFDTKDRIRVAAAGGLAIAAAAPVVANLDWAWAPNLLQQYLSPGGYGHFAFFPCAAYVGFGLAAGALVKRTSEGMDRLMQWSVLVGLALVLFGQYFANLPFSLYERSSFWVDSPALILIRVGIALLMLAGSYLWTEYGAGKRWSWMQCLGKNSLMVYWVHVMLVYGTFAKPIKRTMSVPVTTLATAALIAAMVGLSAGWLWWKEQRAAKQRPAAVPGPVGVKAG